MSADRFTSALPGLVTLPAASAEPTVRAAKRPLRTKDELRAVVAEAAPRLADASAQEVAAWAAEEFGGMLAVACSMADAVLPHLVSKSAPGVDVLFLETGYHFAETVATRHKVEAELPIHVVDVMPKLTVAEQDAKFGAELNKWDPTACCRMRKVEPLAEQLEGYEAWVTGVRRDEAPTRANTPIVTFDELHGLVKINPLAAWTFDDLLAYAQENQVTLNPLLNDGYPSIGCLPCTNRVAPGDDPRSGRWAGLSKTECGIHP
ncbi:phosphoadenylyl-sulfate reductase [Pengzhenrongella sp.]|uniref:phosphoadenylyl-sulfate reductase n=1 Tax=Pengzhenrongella sp. TaxID=2888820 RepID=UPI0039C98FB8